ncbi:MAG: hypothetical protein R3213_00070 [Flavobacteriaceae bacterium]|nr:hypothetical protein [Flavobacteriaceae bacterium]
MTLEEIQARIRTAPELDFGNIFQESIDLFKKSIVHGFVLQIITALLVAPFIIILYVPFVLSAMAVDNNNVYSMEPDGELMVFSTGIIILLVIVVLITGIVAFLLQAGFMRILKMLDDGLTVSTKELFYFFKSEYIGKAALLLLATIIISSIAIILFVLPIFYVIVPLIYFQYVFAFNPTLSKGQIVTASFNLGNKKWLISFGLYMVSSILASIVGFLLCGIGMLFTAPFIYHPLYFIYKKVVGFETYSNEVRAV